MEGVKMSAWLNPLNAGRFADQGQGCVKVVLSLSRDLLNDQGFAKAWRRRPCPNAGSLDKGKVKETAVEETETLPFDLDQN